MANAAVGTSMVHAIAEPSGLFRRFHPEPLPLELAASKYHAYRAFRAVLPLIVIRGQVRSITLTPQGKLAVVVDDQAKFIPQKDAKDELESYILLAPGGFISPELIAKPPT
jgi:hypothetical protein